MTINNNNRLEDIQRLNKLKDIAYRDITMGQYSIDIKMELLKSYAMLQEAQTNLESKTSK